MPDEDKYSNSTLSVTEKKITTICNAQGSETDGAVLPLVLLLMTTESFLSFWASAANDTQTYSNTNPNDVMDGFVSRNILTHTLQRNIAW